MTVDYIRLFSDFGIEYDESGGDWINIQCPHCDDSGHHLGINIFNQYANCWKCGGHNLEYTIKKILRIPNITLSELLTKYSTRFAVFRKVNAKSSVVDNVILPGRALERRHQKYLINRGFDPDFLVEKYHLLGTGVADGLWNFRIIIPIIYRGRVVSFQGRAIHKNMDRYRTLEAEKSIINPKHILFNLDNCPGEKIIITEGPFDAMRLGDGVAATLGIGMSREQIELLSSKYRTVYCVFDPEKMAQKRAEKIGNYLAILNLDVFIVDMEWEHDPGSLTDSEIVIIKKEIGI